MVKKEELGIYESDELEMLKSDLEKDYARFENKEAVVKDAVKKFKNLEELISKKNVENGDVTKAIADARISLEHLRNAFNVHIHNLMNAERAKLS